MDRKILLGNEAIARGAYEAGCRVATAYPGTPSTEILETIARDYTEIRAQWSPNEKVALEVAAGAAIAGARTLVTMKHVGLNVAADPLFTFSYTGINAGLVIINADDPGAWSSQNEQDNRHYARAAKLPMLEPSDLQEAKDFIREAFELSEKYDRPVIVRITTRIAHSHGIVACTEREEVAVRPFTREPQKYVMIPAHARPRHAVIEKQLSALAGHSERCGLNRIERGSSKRGIITDSIAYQYVKEVCPDDSVLKIGMVWPLPEKLIRELADTVDELYIVEETDPFIEQAVKAMGIACTGKGLLPLLGELTPDIIDRALNNKKPEKHFPEFPDALPGRPPVLCDNCPHGYVFSVLTGLDLHVHGDIGCYTLGALPPHSRMHSQACMGASIGMHFGFELAHGNAIARRSVAVIGDSTFVHSGITGLVDLVYNRGTGTVIILDNRSTAMTGHQEHPATGRTLGGEETHQLDLEAVARACGVKHVVSVDPKEVDKLEEVIRTEVAREEPSVIITRRKCILKK